VAELEAEHARSSADLAELGARCARLDDVDSRARRALADACERLARGEQHIATLEAAAVRGAEEEDKKLATGAATVAALRSSAARERGLQEVRARAAEYCIRP
jgi:hypothetical protein